MAATTPPSPRTSPSPPPASLPPPIEAVDHHRQPPNQNSPENLIDCRLPPTEDVEDHQEPPVPASSPPHEELHDHRQPLAPTSPSTGPEHSPENLIPEHVSGDQFDSPNRQPTSPSSSTLPTGSEIPVENPNYRNYPNPNPDHESPFLSSPAPESAFPSPSATTLQENPNPSTKSPAPPSLPTATSPSSPQETLEPSADETPPPEPPLGVPLLLHASASSVPNKPQSSPWTHPETANLIQAYQEKWYSLKKGPLKAGQWEEVAITVAARCGYDEPTKSAKQCRHKIEKLRKRYRAERGKPGSKAAWNFFKLMDNLEKGPLPISSSRPLAMIEYPKSSNSNGKKRKNDDTDGEFHVNQKNSRSKSSSHHIANGGLTRNLWFPDGVMRGSRTPVLQKHKGFVQQENKDEEEKDGYDEEEEGSVTAQLAAEIKGFAEKFVKMENKKIEMIRDTERYRMEMENKRMEMILEAQQMLVETVNKAFSSSHKTQKLSAK